MVGVRPDRASLSCVLPIGGYMPHRLLCAVNMSPSHREPRQVPVIFGHAISLIASRRTWCIVSGARPCRAGV